MFTEAEREQVRTGLIEMAEVDPLITGVAVTGSASHGGQDRWSDIDLFFGVAEAGRYQRCCLKRGAAEAGAQKAVDDAPMGALLAGFATAPKMPGSAKDSLRRAATARNQTRHKALDQEVGRGRLQASSRQRPKIW